MSYSSVAEVKSFTGVQPQDVGFETHQELDTLLAIWLVQIKDLIDQDRNRDYEADGDVPEGIDQIAMKMAANLVRHARNARVGGLMDLEDSPIVSADGRAFTDAIRDDLRRFPAKPRMSLTIAPHPEIEDDDGT